MKNHNVALTCVSFLLLIILTNVVQCEKPEILPPLREWQDNMGVYTFSSNSRIVVNSIYSNKLSAVAQTFAEDIDSLRDIQFQVVYGKYPESGDIFLTLGLNDDSLGNEGYILKIGDHIEINGINETGIFWGTRTVLQMLKHGNEIPAGYARDYPQYKERGLMVDNGRQFFSLAWLKNQVRDLAYIKMNYLHLHFSEDEGFRVECGKYPQIVSPKHLTKSDIIELQHFAAKYHVMIVPEIDMPGHLGAVLQKFPELRLIDSGGNVRGECCLDITQEKSRQLIVNLLEEYLPLFTGTYWHMGTDEYIKDYYIYPQFQKYALKHYGAEARPKDVYYGFINWVDSIVKAHGKTLRIWNDGIISDGNDYYKINLNTDIIIEFWNNEQYVQNYINKGFDVMNCMYYYLYYVPTWNMRPFNDEMYRTWSPSIFAGEGITHVNTTLLKGAKLNIWCDHVDVETETQMAHGICTTMRILSIKTWGTVLPDTSYALLLKLIDSVGLAPGEVYPANPIPGDLAFGKKVFASSVEPESGYIPENAVDGDYATRWSSAYKDSQWIYIDLEKPYHITRAKITWEFAFAVGYEIQTSDDAVNWIPIYKTNEGDGYYDEIDNLDGYGRYVRLFCTKRVAFNGSSPYEIEIFGDTIAGVNSNAMIEINKPQLSCYPNPGNMYFDINYSLNNTQIIQLIITDIMGREIEELDKGEKLPGNYSIRWAATNFTPGIYFCTLKLSNGVYSKKLIINR